MPAHEYNVSLHLLSGIAGYFARDRNTTATLEPVLTIYVGEGRSLLDQLKLPDKAILDCEIEGVDLKSKVARPERKPWYGSVQWDDSTPAVDFAAGLSISITFWQNGSPDGIRLATLDGRGSFATVLSDAELADLNSGRSWLTVTPGNWLTQAKKEDARLPADLLAPQRENAKPLKLVRPKYYYGRVLFEDGSPPLLGVGSPPGAGPFVDFPYAGRAELDSEGYFRVFFEPEQLRQVVLRKPTPNIVWPGQNLAAICPAELLSQDKAKAGVVKIPKPVPVYDPAKAPSLLGKPLPALGGLNLEPAPAALSQRRMLLCFFDLQERPSRYCLAQLAKQAADLQAKGLFLAAIQAAAVDRTTLDSFVKTEKVPFPVGLIAGEEEKTKFNWGIRSQPWLILADNEHIVRAEGFSPDDLSDKLKETAGRGTDSPAARGE